MAAKGCQTEKSEKNREIQHSGGSNITISREINFADPSKSKIAILTILKALNFDFLINVPLENVKSFQKFNIQRCAKVKMVVFSGSR